MGFLVWLGSTDLGQWVASSLWGYPIVLSVHAVGMATVMGLSLMLCARVWGLGAAMPLAALLRLRWLAVAGFVLNAASGIALFAGKPEKLWASPPFPIKLGFIVLAVGLTVGLVRQLTAQRQAVLAEGSAMDIDGQRTLKLMAGLCGTAWLCVLVAGRMIAYFEPV